MSKGTSYVIDNNEKDNQLEIEMDGHKAILSYRLYKGDLALMHTRVPTELSGRGIGTALAKAAFGYALDLKKMVLVYCPFIAAFVKKNPEYERQLDPKYHGATS